MSIRQFLTICFAACASLLVRAQEITFRATVDRNEIATGENLKLTIELTNAASGGMTTPDMGGLAVVQGPMESSSFSFINGRSSRSTTRVWYLTATRPGTFTIGPSKVRVGNGELSTDPITINVAKGAASSTPGAAADQAQQRDPNLFCTISLSKNKAYVGEQIIATYTLYSRYNSLQPRDYDLPKLNGFWAEEVDLGATNWEQQLHTVNGLQYRVAILKKQVLIPLRAGKLTVAPMTLNYLVNPGFFSSGTPVRIQSNPTDVAVVELPSPKPPDFTGAVGDLRLEVKTPSAQVKANEAIDLSITFSGRANLKLVDAPKLSLPPDWDSYDPKVIDKITVNGAGMSGSREYQYLVIPRHEGKYDLGALTFSYFDPATASYKQLRSQPLSYTVAPGDARAANTAGAAAKVDVQRLGSDIRYIRTGDLQLRPKGKFLFGSTLWILGMAAPIGLLVLAFAWQRRREKRLGDAQGQRRRGADRVAKKRLAEAEAALSKGDPAIFHDALGRALEGYFADKFNLGVAEVNADKIQEKLAPLDGGKSAGEYIALLNGSQMARFAPLADKPTRQAYDEAAEIISRIETLLRK